MVKVVGAAMEEEEEEIASARHTASLHAAPCRTPPLCSIRLARATAREASIFHIANTRFWEAALLPIAVVVVIAFSSCMDFWIGQFISLSWWYAANFYSMAYALQVLHPQISALAPAYHCSPFGGAWPLWLWSLGIAALEMCIYHLAGQPRAAHAVGTTLYGLCGCLWLHAVIAPWRCIPTGWRPHKVLRYVTEHRLLELPRRQGPAAPVAGPGAAGEAVGLRTGEALPHRPARRAGAPRGAAAAGTCAGHAALAIAGYGLVVAWRCAAQPSALPSADPQLGKRPTSIAAARSAPPGRSRAPALSAHPHSTDAAYRPAVRSTNAAAAAKVIAKGSEAIPPRGDNQTSRSTVETTVMASEQRATAGLPVPAPSPEMPVVLAPAQRLDLNSSLDEQLESSPVLKEGHSVPNNLSLGVGTKSPGHRSGNRSAAALVMPPPLESDRRARKEISPQGAQSNGSAATEAPALGTYAATTEGALTVPARPHPWLQQQEHEQQTPLEASEVQTSAVPRVPASVPPAPVPPAVASATQQKPTQAWGGVLLLGSLAMLLLWLADYGKSFEFSVPYLVCFNLVCIRVPDLLGHVVITSLGDVSLYSSPAMATTAISFAYMGSMQVYLMIMRWVCDNMGSQHLFPRFHFVAQMYYYLFWYVMLMVISPAGIEDWNFWIMVAMLNGNYLVSNIGVLQQLFFSLRCRLPPPDPPLKILFDSKLAVQDQLADVVSLLIVPAIATSFHICTALSVTEYPGGVLISLWQRFGALLIARLLSGLLTEEIFRRRVELLYKADAMELQLLPLDTSQNRLRYLNDICVGPKLAHESMRNIERCELYFTAIAVICTFAVFQHGDVPTRYAFIVFGT